MSKSFSLTLAVAIVSVLCWGCTSNVTPESSANATSAQTDGHEHATLCGGCGHDKGTEACCAEGAEECGDCGLSKGSKLCCVELSADAKGKDLCGSCGHVDGSESCCARRREM